MPVFNVSIIGENFCIALAGEPESRYGFWANRLVQSDSELAIDKQSVVNQILSAPSLEGWVTNSSDDPPRVAVQRSQELDPSVLPRMVEQMVWRLENLSDPLPRLTTADEIQILDLANLKIGPGNLLRDGRQSPTLRLQDGEVSHFLSLWKRLRQLPLEREARCHIPPFAFRFRSKGHTIFEASVCWRCNNIYAYVSDQRLKYVFATDDDPAIELLKLAEQKVGHSATE